MSPIHILCLTSYVLHNKIKANQDMSVTTPSSIKQHEIIYSIQGGTRFSVVKGELIPGNKWPTWLSSDWTLWHPAWHGEKKTRLFSPHVGEQVTLSHAHARLHDIDTFKYLKQYSSWVWYVVIEQSVGPQMLCACHNTHQNGTYHHPLTPFIITIIN